MTTPATPVEPRTAVMRLTLLDGSTWTDKGIRDFAAYLGQQFEMRAEPAAAGVPLREALERLVKAARRIPTKGRDDPMASDFMDALEQSRAALVAAAPTVEPQPCTTCNHPYSEHTGRSLYNGHLRPDKAQMGHGCEHREDFHHTCSCSRYAEPQRAAAGLDVERLAKALEQADRAVMDEGELAGAAAYREMARHVAAEYARAATAEESQP